MAKLHRLLVITQKMDINDPVLGFFHYWVEEFGKRCNRLTVICLQKGQYDLPQNVKVLSLGKPAQGWSASGREKLLQKPALLFRFYKYIWQERKNYDVVFVHMNQEYILLAGLFWKMAGKKIMLWRNHAVGSFLTKIVVGLSDKVFCTSKKSFTAKFKKTEIMPAGIDTDLFRRKSEIKRDSRLILFLGRMSLVKKPDLLIGALDILNKKNVDFRALLVGDPAVKDDEKYYEELKDLVSRFGLQEKIEFLKGISNKEAVDYYNKCGLLVNLTPSGSMDKVILEAMACECPVVVSNELYKGVISSQFIFKEGDKIDLAEKIKNALDVYKDDDLCITKKQRDYVLKNHGLHFLIDKIFSFL